MAKKQSKRRTKVAAAPEVEVGSDVGIVTTVERADGVIVKKALTDEGRRHLAREVTFLEALAGTGVAPRLMERTESQLVVEDLGDGEGVQDGARFVTNSVLLLNELRANGVRHGDLTSRNVIVRNDFPVAIDFAQSKFVDEGGPYKRPKPDAYYFWQAVASLVPTCWEARYVQRWQAIRKELGGDEDGAWDCLAGRSVVDLGCYDGLTLAMAVAEGADGIGVDKRADVLAAATERWGRFGCQFLRADLMGYEPEPADIVFLFSTWTYIVRDHGREAAEETLARLVKRSRVLFFETQLYGDGPGPDFLRDDLDVAALLGRYGKAKLLATLPVSGRPAHRSVWSVQS